MWQPADWEVENLVGEMICAANLCITLSSATTDQLLLQLHHKFSINLLWFINVWEDDLRSHFMLKNASDSQIIAETIIHSH